ncbi:MAG: hypothetical protein ABJE47_09055 [bacterium]
MKPFILPFLIAMLAGLGVAGGAAVMSAKGAPAPAAADSSKHAATDTTAVRVIDSSGAVAPQPATHADSIARGAMPVVKTETTAPAHANGVPAVPSPAPKSAASGPTATVIATPGERVTPPKGPIVANATAADAPPAEKRIARVIAAMAPRDAAKVLTQMADHDIAIIIGNLSEKQEAAILAALPADRLATVSKLLLRPAPVVK